MPKKGLSKRGSHHAQDKTSSLGGCVRLLKLVLGLLMVWIALRGPSNEILVNNQTSKAPSESTKAPQSKKHGKLASGWDQAGLDYYNQQAQNIRSMAEREPDLVIDLASRGNVTVSPEVIGNVNFWNGIDGRRHWEESTFRIFETYVAADTIVVDFGCWIGPTLLFHGQFSQRSYGIEADPVAFATLQYNLEANRHREWYSRVAIESLCVGVDEVSTTMRGAKEPGASMSGITDKLFRPFAGSWQVQCYTLEHIVVDHWGVDLAAQPVVIKVDVESYECKLVPSFYNWLKDQPRLPILYITFHPEIEDCTPQEWAGVLKTFLLYERISARGDTQVLSIEPTTTVEQFAAMREAANWRRESTFVVSGKRTASPVSSPMAASFP